MSNCDKRCVICTNCMVFDNTFKCTTTGKYYKVKEALFCNSVDVVCLTTGQCDNFQYTGLATIFKDLAYIKVQKIQVKKGVVQLNIFQNVALVRVEHNVVEQTNIFSFQTIHKSVNTNCAEIMSLIGMSIKMGILQLPFYKSYCSGELCCARIADVMPRNHYQELLRYLHFVNNDSINVQDKLTKIHSLISIVRDKFVKIEPEEYNLFGEQIIPSKAKYLSIRQYNQKNPKNWGFKNLVLAGIFGFMHDFLVYYGKNSEELDDGKFGHLQKCAQVVAKLCDDLRGQKNYKVFLDNWFTTSNLLHHD